MTRPTTYAPIAHETRHEARSALLGMIGGALLAGLFLAACAVGPLLFALWRKGVIG